MEKCIYGRKFTHCKCIAIEQNMLENYPKLSGFLTGQWWYLTTVIDKGVRSEKFGNQCIRDDNQCVYSLGPLILATGPNLLLSSCWQLSVSWKSHDLRSIDIIWGGWGGPLLGSPGCNSPARPPIISRTLKLLKWFTCSSLHIKWGYNLF